jgi:hypothetical protein
MRLTGEVRHAEGVKTPADINSLYKVRLSFPPFPRALLIFPFSLGSSTAHRSRDPPLQHPQGPSQAPSRPSLRQQAQVAVSAEAEDLCVFSFLSSLRLH